MNETSREVLAYILRKELGEAQQDKSIPLASRYIGQYVIVRSRNEGINAGVVIAADETGIVLSDARRLWYHKPKIGSWYEGVSTSGLSDDSKVSPTVAEKAIIEDYSIVTVSDIAQQSIQSAVPHNG